MPEEELSLLAGHILRNRERALELPSGPARSLLTDVDYGIFTPYDDAIVARATELGLLDDAVGEFLQEV